jgi:hypothetical protein
MTRERERERESPRENIHTYPAFPVRKIAHKVVNRADADTEQGIHDHERHCRLQRSSSKRHPVSLPATSLNTFHQQNSAICTNNNNNNNSHTKKKEEKNAHLHTQIPEEQKFQLESTTHTLKFSGFHPDAKKETLMRTNPISRTHKQTSDPRTERNEEMLEEKG